MTAIPSQPIRIVAEVAQGFEGDIRLAHMMIRAAAAAGADAVKFQLVYADELATPGYKFYDLFKGLEMSDGQWQELADAAKARNIEMQCDIFGRTSLKLAETIGLRTVKLHGTDTANPALLRDVANSDVETVMLGAGGGYRGEIDRALDILSEKKIVLLLGFQSYPTPTEANQVARVSEMVARFADRGNITVGFADHADPEDPLRLAIAASAVGAGARLIEKHITLGRNMEIEDFESALNPDQFAEFVRTVRAVDLAVGTVSDTDDFGMTAAEQGYRLMIRRHVVTAHGLSAGHTLTEADLVLKRAATENPLTEIEQAVGKTIRRDIAANEAITADDLEA